MTRALASSVMLTVLALNKKYIVIWSPPVTLTWSRFNSNSTFRITWSKDQSSNFILRTRLNGDSWRTLLISIGSSLLVLMRRRPLRKKRSLWFRNSHFLRERLLMTVKLKTQTSSQLTQELKMLQLKMSKHKLKNHHLRRNQLKRLRKLWNIFNKKMKKRNLQLIQLLSNKNLKTPILRTLNKLKRLWRRNQRKRLRKKPRRKRKQLRKYKQKLRKNLLKLQPRRRLRVNLWLNPQNKSKFLHRKLKKRSMTPK